MLNWKNVACNIVLGGKYQRYFQVGGLNSGLYRL